MYYTVEGVSAARDYAQRNVTRSDVVLFADELPRGHRRRTPLAAAPRSRALPRSDRFGFARQLLCGDLAIAKKVLDAERRPPDTLSPDEVMKQPGPTGLSVAQAA